MKPVVIFLGLLLCAASARARTATSIPLSQDAGATISVGCCFSTVALAGYAPIDVTINNHSGQTRQWVFQFTSPAYSFGVNANNTVQSAFTATVENNGTRTVPMLVPTAFVPNGQPPLRVEVKGYGVEGSVMQTLGQFGTTGKSPTPFVAISESLGTPVWSNLSKQIDSLGRDLMGSTVNPDDLPEDWRGLSGVAGIWMTGDELDHLSAAQRNAILTWVHAGGWLMLCGVTEAPADFRMPGFGEVRTLPAKLDIDQTKDTIHDLPAFDASARLGSSPQASGLLKVKPNVPLLFAFMVLFAIVVGPVNVFALAGTRRRERLFWTTPLISLCASGLLMGMIVASDGLGGHGIRSAVVCLFPDGRNAVIMQEQVSRMGLLLNSGFQTRDPVYMRQLDLSSLGTPGGRQLQDDGTSYGGGWFTSRAAQAQRIVSVVPTRAEVALLNAADVRDKGAAPVVLSSFETTLDFFLYSDEQHRIWQGKALRTGQKQTLEPAPQGSTVIGRFSLGSESLKKLAVQPGYFQATSDEGGDFYTATLGSIHWTDQPVTYVGPVVVNP